MNTIALFDHVNTLHLPTGGRPSRHPEIPAQAALSPDIDRMGPVLDIVHQAHGIDRLFAHSIRVGQMSFTALGRRNYTLYLRVLAAIKEREPLRLVKQSDRVFVPIHRVYLAHHSEHSGWTLDAVNSACGEVLPEAVRFQRTAAVETMLSRLRTLLEEKVARRTAHESLLQTPVHVFDKPPVSTDADAAMVEAVWRTVKHRFPNEVMLAELSL